MSRASGRRRHICSGTCCCNMGARLLVVDQSAHQAGRFCPHNSECCPLLPNSLQHSPTSPDIGRKQFHDLLWKNAPEVGKACLTIRQHRQDDSKSGRCEVLAPSLLPKARTPQITSGAGAVQRRENETVSACHRVREEGRKRGHRACLRLPCGSKSAAEVAMRRARAANLPRPSECNVPSLPLAV